MTVSTDILFESDAWDEDQLTDWADRAFATALAHVGLGAGTWEVSVLACDNTRIAALNADFRGKTAPTNVLSWPSEERAAEIDGGLPNLPDPHSPVDCELGDIAIAYETCLAEANSAAKPFDQHVTHLLVHALLHLLGYDHESDKDAALMEQTETAILASLGHPDPYRDY